MPVVSKAQNRWAHWAEAHPKEAGARTAAAAAEFVQADHGRSLKDLPERVQHKCEGGSVGTYPSRTMGW